MSDGGPKLLLTAEEAYPAFETAVLDARDRVVMGFRIFDPVTRLRTDRGREIGTDWTDLMIHTLRRGISVDLTLSDFDPIGSPAMHTLTWESMRKCAAIAELAGPDAAPFRYRAALHPTRVGWLTAAILWPRVGKELSEIRQTLNDLPPDLRHARFRHLPGLHRWLRLDAEGRVGRGARGPFPLHPVSHHQKLAVIDGEILYIGGLDLNPRRYDTKRHHRPGEETWHDVQILVRGPAAAAAEAHLTDFVAATEGRAEAPGETSGLRLTLTRRRDNPMTAFGPRPLRDGLRTEIASRLRACRRVIYLETQFFRDRALADLLSRQAQVHRDLELLMVLPAAPEDVAFEGRSKMDSRFGEYLQARCVQQVRRAFGRRAYFAAPAQPLSGGTGVDGHRDRHFGAPLIYVHAKLCVFDDAATLVSSANLNGRSLSWDTEAGLVVEGADFARSTRARALAHWCRDRPIDLEAPLVPQIRDMAEEDRLCQPEDRRTFLLPYDHRPGRRFGMPLPGVPDEMV